MDAEFAEAAMAIVVSDHDALRELLQADPGLATRQSSVSHPTLLQLVACEAANLVDAVGSARVLVAAGAPIDGPLVAAAGCGSSEIVALLLGAGAALDGGGAGAWTPLDEALYWSQTAVARQLLDAGASLLSLRAAAGVGNVAAVGAFFDGASLRPTAGPIRSPFVDTVPAALENDPQHIIDHAFVMAIENLQLGSAAELVDRGANINGTPIGYHWQGAAIHSAAARGDAMVVTWLLDRGADPTIRDGMVNADAVGWALHHEHPEIADLLRRAGH